MVSKIVNISGKRKRSVARATLREGKGIIRINGYLLDLYGNELMRMKINEPLMIAEDYAKKVNIDVNVFGGGVRGQADAVRLAIGRALVEFTKDKKLKQDLLDYDRNLLVADVRFKETRKPNDSKARKKRQKSYR